MLQKQVNRLRRKQRIRAKITGTATKPRLSLFRSSNNIYVQMIDDTQGKTLAFASDLSIDTKWLTKTQRAQKVGEEIAKLAENLKIQDVVFDRGGFSYHGRVKTLADAAREGGLKF